MTPEEVKVLQQIGTDIVRTFVAIVIHTITITVYTFFAFKAIRVLLRIGRTKVTMTTLAIIVTMYLSAFVLWVLDVTNFITEATMTLLHSQDIPIAVRYAKAQRVVFDHLVATDLLYAYMSNLGDAVIIWRVWAFWRHTSQKWILIVPWSFLFGSIITSLLLTYCGARVGASIVNGSFQKPLFCKNVQTASYSTGFATTTVATILIGIKTWQYRRTIKPLVSSSGRVSQVEKIMTLLFESGILYFIFFLVPVLGNIPGVEAKSASSFAFLVYSYSTSVIVGLYPTIVVVLAHSEHAVLDTAAATQLSTWHVARTTATDWSSQVRSESTRLPDDIEVNFPVPSIKETQLL